MIGLVIVGHGKIAQEYFSAIEHILGSCTNVECVSIDPLDIREKKRTEIKQAIKNVDSGSGVIIATDMFGSTPSNLAVEACIGSSTKVIFGTNLPLLVKLLKCRRLPLEKAVLTSVNSAKKYIDIA